MLQMQNAYARDFVKLRVEIFIKCVYNDSGLEKIFILLSLDSPRHGKLLNNISVQCGEFPVARGDLTSWQFQITLVTVLPTNTNTKGGTLWKQSFILDSSVSQKIKKLLSSQTNSNTPIHDEFLELILCFKYNKYGKFCKDLVQNNCKKSQKVIK